MSGETRGGVLFAGEPLPLECAALHSPMAHPCRRIS
jgi:hypothetical protein